MTDAKRILENLHYRVESMMEKDIIPLMTIDEYYYIEDVCVRPTLSVVNGMRDCLDEL